MAMGEGKRTQRRARGRDVSAERWAWGWGALVCGLCVVCVGCGAGDGAAGEERAGAEVYSEGECAGEAGGEGIPEGGAGLAGGVEARRYVWRAYWDSCAVGWACWRNDRGKREGRQRRGSISEKASDNRFA